MVEACKISLDVDTERIVTVPVTLGGRWARIAFATLHTQMYVLELDSYSR